MFETSYYDGPLTVQSHGAIRNQRSSTQPPIVPLSKENHRKDRRHPLGLHLPVSHGLVGIQPRAWLCTRPPLSLTKPASDTCTSHCTPHTCQNCPRGLWH